MRLHPALLGTLAALVVAGCGAVPGAPTSTGSDGSGVTGVVTAGPTCSVAQEPPDPACADRAVPGAVLEVVRPDGTRVAAVQSDALGRFAVTLAPGNYRLVPQPVDGLLGTAAPIDVEVAAGQVVDLLIAYDTGIRGPG